MEEHSSSTHSSTWPLIHMVAQFTFWMIGHFASSPFLEALRVLYGWSDVHNAVIHAGLDFWASTLQTAMAIFGGVQLYQAKAATVRAENK